MKHKLLIVDDLPENIKLLANVLSTEGFDIEFATGGYEAIKCLDAEPFDLILLDIMMPDLNGFETCKIIKKKPEQADIPIIFLTAISDIASIKEGFKVGGIDYVTKPFNPQELLLRIRTQLELRENRKKLKELNQHLERKVEERTSELINTMNQLQEANDELTKLEDAKNNFLKIVSHELRTPLNSILGFTELIKENPDPEDLPLLLNGLNRAAWRLEKLSYTALNITKLNLDADQLDLEQVSLANLTKNALTVLQNAGTKINCEFHTSRISNTIKVIGDRNLIQQCLYNIVENANQHATNCFMSIDYNRRGEVIYKITDDGRGFSKDVLDNPFKLFSPGHTYINKNAGLGLALSNLIMEAHGGSIEISNHDLGGAEVFLTFKKTK